MTAETGAGSTAGATEIVSDTTTEPTLGQKLTAEVLGTFILVLFGCGSAVFATIFAAQQQSRPDLAFITTVGLTFGVAIVVAVYAFGRISGGHFNPAVSAGAAISGRISWVTAGFYMAAQVVGAIVGAFVLWVFAHGWKGYDSTQLGLGQNHFGGSAGYAWWAAFLLELVLTAVFVYVILGTTDERNPYSESAPLAIGLTLSAIHFVAIPATGTSVNPARSIGPALFSGGHAIGQLWLFILAPLIGGAIAGITYPLLFGRTGDPVPGSSFIDVIALFQDDPETELIVMSGEIGGDAEEQAAEFIAKNVTKPVVGYIAGFTAPPGKTMGHAGAIVSGSKGTAAAKAEALEACGVRVGRTPTQVAEIAVEILGG